jgi:hypothetical protein
MERHDKLGKQSKVGVRTYFKPSKLHRRQRTSQTQSYDYTPFYQKAGWSFTRTSTYGDFKKWIPNAELYSRDQCVFYY